MDEDDIFHCSLPYLDKLHRFIRLHRWLDLSFDELAILHDSMCKMTSGGVTANFSKDKLHAFGLFKYLRDEYDFSVWDVAALFGTLVTDVNPTTAHLAESQSDKSSSKIPGKLDLPWRTASNDETLPMEEYLGAVFGYSVEESEAFGKISRDWLTTGDHGKNRTELMVAGCRIKLLTVIGDISVADVGYALNALRLIEREKDAESPLVDWMARFVSGQLNSIVENLCSFIFIFRSILDWCRRNALTLKELNEIATLFLGPLQNRTQATDDAFFEEKAHTSESTSEMLEAVARYVSASSGNPLDSTIAALHALSASDLTALMQLFDDSKRKSKKDHKSEPVAIYLSGEPVEMRPFSYEAAIHGLVKKMFSLSDGDVKYLTTANFMRTSLDSNAKANKTTWLISLNEKKSCLDKLFRIAAYRNIPNRSTLSTDALDKILSDADKPGASAEGLGDSVNSAVDHWLDTQRECFGEMRSVALLGVLPRLREISNDLGLSPELVMSLASLPQDPDIFGGGMGPVWKKVSETVYANCRTDGRRISGTPSTAQV